MRDDAFKMVNINKREKKVEKTREQATYGIETPVFRAVCNE